MGPCRCKAINLSWGTGQDLAEPETLEAEATSVSILHMRAVRELKFCSISANAAILVAKVLTICSLFVILAVRRTTELVMVWMWLS